ncbi:MAG TPA: nuclear transport factor 2 family protein [Candidatus Dormibacteraeota bacterium]
MAEAGTKLSLDERIQVVRNGFEAFKRGDIKTLSDQFTDDAVWHEAGSTVFGGDHRGKQAVVENIVRFAQTYQDIGVDVHDIVANDKHAIALVNSTFARNGKTYKVQEAFVFHVNDDAKVSEAWLITDTEQLKASLEN